MANRAQRRQQARTQATSRRTPSVLMATPYGEFDSRYVASLAFLLNYDAVHERHIIGNGGWYGRRTSNIAHGRNQIVKEFLDRGYDYLWFFDSDQECNPDTLARLVHVAEQGHPIVGGLVFSYDTNDAQPIVPTIWMFAEADNQLSRVLRIPSVEDPVWPCAATGTGCVLIHRQVLLDIRDMAIPGGTGTYGQTAWPWFQFGTWLNRDGEPDVMSEDLVFMLRANAAGHHVVVDLSNPVGHIKKRSISVADYLQQPVVWAGNIPNYVVVPVKGRHDLTDALLLQLAEEGSAARVFVYDNGADTDPYMTDRENVEVIPAAGQGIHEMWNAGVRAAQTHAEGACNIAILNNDLKIGPNFLDGLALMLRADPRIGAVSPNYDDRAKDTAFQPVRGIAANRYDGTGGLAGFAFMVKGEQAGDLYPYFDETYRWWYGDNDFCLELDQAGMVYGIVTGVPCEHVGGGSQTEHDPEWDRLIAEDRAYFKTKWGLVESKPGQLARA